MNKPKIETGFRVGMLTMTAPTKERKNGYTIWHCQCDCGEERLLDTRALQRGTLRDCGCKTKLPPGANDLTGRRFGKLLVGAPTERRESGWVVWRCRCDCGNETVVGQTLLQSGKTKSCGCLQNEIIKENLKLVDGTSVTILEANKKRQWSSNTSGHKGVCQNKKNGRWVAQITFKGKTYYLGSYKKLEDAVKARQRSEEMHDDFLAWYYDLFPKRNRQTRRTIQNKGHWSESRMERRSHRREDAKNPFGTKGALLYRGQALYVRSARQTARTPECPGCFASLRSDKGLHPLRRFAAIPADFAIDAPC